MNPAPASQLQTSPAQTSPVRRAQQRVDAALQVGQPVPQIAAEGEDRPPDGLPCLRGPGR